MRILCVLLALAACHKKESKPPDIEHLPPDPGKSGTEMHGETPASNTGVDLYGDPLPTGAVARLGSLRMVDRAIREMRFTKDGSEIISNTRGGYQLWSVTDASRVRVLADERGSDVIAVSPDGKTMATGTVDGGIISLWDLEKGRITDTIKAHTEPVAAMCYLDANHLVSAAGDGRLKVWALDERREAHSLQGRWTAVTALACAASGEWAAFGTAEGGAYLLGKGSDEVIELGVDDDGITSVAIAPGGGAFAFGTRSEEILTWSSPSPSAPMRLKAHERVITDLAFSPDGKKLYSTGGDWWFRIWDAKSGQMLEELPGVDGLEAQRMAISPDGTLLASWSVHSNERGSEAGRWWLWRAQDGSLLLEPQRHRQNVTAVDVSPDGKWIATASEDRTVWLWSSDKAQAHKKFDAAQGPVFAVHFARDGQSVFSAGKDALLMQWSWSTEDEATRIEGVGGAVNAFAISTDGKRAFTGDQIGRVWAWDLTTGTKIQAYDAQGYSAIYDLALSADDKLLAIAGSDRLIRLVDLEAGREIAQLNPGQAAANMAVAFAPDGSMLATGGDDHKIHLWSTKDWTLTRTLGGHDGTVRTLAFSADGSRLASGGNDEIVRVWDVKSGQPKQELVGHLGVITDLVFAPTGDRLISTSQDRTALVWGVQ